MKYEFIFIFKVVPAYPFYDEMEILDSMIRHNLKGFIYETTECYRVVIKGSPRRRVEEVMFECKGQDIRILDEFTYTLLRDYIKSPCVAEV